MVYGKQVRLSRITETVRGAGIRMLCVPMDHSFTLGPIQGLEDTPEMIRRVARGGATSILVHKGIIKALASPPPLGLIMHLNASTTLGPSPNRKVLVSSVREAVRLGADAVSIHVNMGSREEPEMLHDLGLVADECDELQMPLIAMMYARGENIREPVTPDVVAHVARVGAEAGADIVKVVYTGSTESFREVVRRCPAPVVLAGGPRAGSDEEVLRLAKSVMDAGAIGVTFGRNIFQHPDPQLMVRALRKIVVEGRGVEDAMEVMRAGRA